MVKTMVAVAVATVLGMVGGMVYAKSDNWVGAPELLGPAKIVDWHTSVNLEERTVTVTGWVENVSDVTLTNVLVGIADEELDEVPCVPETIEPRDRCRFTGTMYTGTNLTVRAYVMADAVPAARYMPNATR